MGSGTNDGRWAKLEANIAHTHAMEEDTIQKTLAALIKEAAKFKVKRYDYPVYGDDPWSTWPPPEPEPEPTENALGEIAP